MIYGIGLDIVEVERIETLMEEHETFLSRFFAEEEIALIQKRKNRAETAAGRFAVKEAFSKALGTGIRGFSFKEVVTENNALGKPVLKLKGKAAAVAKEMGIGEIFVSISHEKHYAAAEVIILKEERQA